MRQMEDARKGADRPVRKTGLRSQVNAHRSKERRSRSSIAIRRVCVLAGAALALAAGAWAGNSLSLDQVEFRLRQGPHLCIHGCRSRGQTAQAAGEAIGEPGAVATDG